MRFPTPDPAHRQVLRLVLEQAARLRAGGVAVFDLDSTLFDNLPRQARILREFGEARGIPELQASVAEHWPSGWEMREAMIAAGLSEAAADGLLDEAKAFWQERFFTSPYCLEDRPIAGAPAFVRALRESGARIAYCTGRHEPMREGSAESLRRWEFPVPGDEGVELVMKPRFDVTDDEFKRIAHERLRRMGRVFAAFDNEPTHINDYRRTFPEALVVHLATDHSGRPVEVHPDIPAVVDFTLGDDA